MSPYPAKALQIFCLIPDGSLELMDETWGVIPWTTAYDPSLFQVRFQKPVPGRTTQGGSLFTRLTLCAAQPPG